VTSSTCACSSVVDVARREMGALRRWYGYRTVGRLPLDSCQGLDRTRRAEPEPAAQSQRRGERREPRRTSRCPRPRAGRGNPSGQSSLAHIRAMINRARRTRTQALHARLADATDGLRTARGHMELSCTRASRSRDCNDHADDEAAAAAGGAPEDRPSSAAARGRRAAAGCRGRAQGACGVARSSERSNLSRKAS
jgi:hypothetical protein